MGSQDIKLTVDTKLTPARLRELTARGKEQEAVRAREAAERRREEVARLARELDEQAAPVLKAFRDRSYLTAERGRSEALVMDVPQEQCGPQFMSHRTYSPADLRGVAAHVYKTLLAEGFQVWLRMASTSRRDGYEVEWDHRLLMEAGW